jgi:protein-S-isoprenylcysteine O-methyltransferase Ste14
MLKDRGGEHPFGDAGQLAGFLLFFGVWITDSFFLHRSTFLAAEVPLAARLAFLFAALIIAIQLVRKSHIYIIHGRRTERVLDEGAFRWVRHPLYLAGILAFLGVAVSTASLMALAVWALLAIFYAYISSYEERFLEERFGDAYREYKARTGKWIPRLRHSGK